MDNYRSTYLIVVMLIIGFVVGDFNCRRKGFSCQEGSTCGQNGSCLCPPNRSGFDCTLDTALIGCDENVCKNGGICYDNGKCSCSPDTYGEKCQYHTVSSECLGTELKMSFAAPQSFSGEVYASGDSVNCKFNEVEAEVPGWKKFTLNIPFDGDNVCSNMVNQTLDEPSAGDISRYVDVIVSYNPMFISNTDRLILYRCVHKGSNFTMFAELDDVSLNERTNLRKDVHAMTYAPVRFLVLDKDGNALDKPLFVGDMFKLLFYLGDTAVYQSLRIDYCIANNTMAEKPIRFEFVKDGCPTDEGKSILVDTNGPTSSRYLHPIDNVEVPASELLMYAFKFKGTTNVGFNCAVQICKKGDESLCQPKQCSISSEKTETSTKTPTIQLSATTVTPGVTNNQTLVATTIGEVVRETTAAAVVTESIMLETVTSEAPSAEPAPGNNTALRRKRSSRYGDRQFLSAVVTVQEPNLEELLILPNINHSKKSNVESGTSTNRDHNKDCLMSEEMIIVIIVMATVIFVFIVISTLLTISVMKNRRRIRILNMKQRSEFYYTIPRPRFDKK